MLWPKSSVYYYYFCSFFSSAISLLECCVPWLPPGEEKIKIKEYTRGSSSPTRPRQWPIPLWYPRGLGCWKVCIQELFTEKTARDCRYLGVKYHTAGRPTTQPQTWDSALNPRTLEVCVCSRTCQAHTHTHTVYTWRYAERRATYAKNTSSLFLFFLSKKANKRIFGLVVAAAKLQGFVVLVFMLCLIRAADSTITTFSYGSLPRQFGVSFWSSWSKKAQH